MSTLTTRVGEGVVERGGVVRGGAAEVLLVMTTGGVVVKMLSATVTK